MKIKSKLIIGLGNPDKEYQNTYHNVGFLAVDFLANSLPLAKLLKSDSYMNESGLFVLKAVKKNGLKPEEVLIIHDDADIELGKYKLSFGRGSAGHRGVESIINSLGTKNFWRLRIGINKISNIKNQKSKRIKAADFVLKKISKADLETLLKVFDGVVKKVFED